MGGLVVQKYLESHPAAAGVLLASVPPSGVLRTTLNIARKHPLRFLRLNLTWNLYPLVSTPRLARENLFSASMPEDVVRAYASRVENEAYFAFLDMLAFNLPRPRRVNVPMLVLGGERDAIFIPSEVRATARAYHTDTAARIFPNMAHDMMLEPAWKDVADAILTWLGARNL
jgi:pimeloyl-ACP methyl ester carboxylesterase